MSQDMTALLNAMQKHSAAVKLHLQVGTAGNAANLEGKTLAQIMADAAAAANAYTDAEVQDLVEGNALIEAVDAAIADLGAPVGGEFNTAILEKVVALAGSDISVIGGNHFTKTITGNTAFTVSDVPAAGRVVSFALYLTNGGAATITWWPNINWADGVVPELTAAGRDNLAFTTMDGGATWDGYLLGKNMKLPV